MLSKLLKSAALSILMLAALHAHAAPVQAENRAKALFEVKMGQSRFVIKIQGRQAVRDARRIIRTKRPVFMMGQVVAAPASYNRKWRFHVEPSSIQFIELAMEVCDANPRFIQENLSRIGDGILPNGIWCPWASKLSKELPR